VVLGAEAVDRERALALGMVDELTEPGELLPRAVTLAAQLAARSPESYRLAKAQLHRAANEVMAATAADDTAVLAGWTSEDTRRRIEAAVAALARRQPATPAQLTSRIVSGSAASSSSSSGGRGRCTSVRA
jgi:enoyl-CoA hydratase